MLFRALILLLATSVCWAQDPVYNRISLTASAQDELANDTMQVVLYAFAQEKDAESAGKQVNQDMAWAVKQAEREDGIKIQTLGYHTSPVYRDQRIVAWKVEQSVRLESQKTDLLASLTAELQEKLAVRSMNFDASESSREAKENELISRALEAFETRAKLISENLDAYAYKIAHINVSTDRHYPAPRMEMMRGVAKADAAPATVEMGTQTVSVTISGEIELQ